MRSKERNYSAAIYLRISRDDEERSESNSIQNQRELLKSYIEKTPGIEFKREFSDDGYTGTNYDRPGFIKMMDMVHSKDINCIIVKDLSRLGRNYIDTGKYIEQVFPSLGVRFISVNDNYDSLSKQNESDQIIIPFKNLINDAYCRDISMKIRSQLDVKRKNGKFIGAFAAYGYLKDPTDKYHLIIDRTAAEIVRMIFDMKLEGYSEQRIADRLNAMGVLTPQEYKKSIGLNSNAGYWRSDRPVWVPAMVKRLLVNDVYIGNMSQGKFRKVNYKVDRLMEMSERDWIRSEGTHEAIISKGIFDRVQEMLLSDTRTSPSMETVSIFSGMVKCADCGQNMIRRNTKKGGKEYVYFTCSTAKTGGDCTSHLINAERLEEIVLHAVQEQMKLLLDAGRLIREIDNSNVMPGRIAELDKRIESCESEIRRYKVLREKVYIDYSDGIIDAEDFENLRMRFREKEERASQIASYLIAERDQVMNEPLLPPEWLHDVEQIGAITELTRKIVVMLIDRIVIHSKKEVEIIFRYCDEIAEINRKADSFDCITKTEIIEREDMAV